MGALGAARLSLVIAQSAPRPDEIFSFLHPVPVACVPPTAAASPIKTAPRRLDRVILEADGFRNQAFERKAP